MNFELNLRMKYRPGLELQIQILRVHQSLKTVQWPFESCITTQARLLQIFVPLIFLTLYISTYLFVSLVDYEWLWIPAFFVFSFESGIEGAFALPKPKEKNGFGFGEAELFLWSFWMHNFVYGMGMELNFTPFSCTQVFTDTDSFLRSTCAVVQGRLSFSVLHSFGSLNLSIPIRSADCLATEQMEGGIGKGNNISY